MTQEKSPWDLLLALCTIDIGSQIILCPGGRPVCCRMFSSIPDLDPLDISSTLPAGVMTPKNVSNIAKCPLGDKTVFLFLKVIVGYCFSHSLLCDLSLPGTVLRAWQTGSLTEAHGLWGPFIFLFCCGKHIKQQGLPISLVTLRVLPLPPTSPSREEERCWQGKEVRVLAPSLLRSVLLEPTLLTIFEPHL